MKVTHGHARRGQQSPEFRTWISMRKRCNEPNRPYWKHYGGRGIRVCARWNESFEHFLEDMGPKPSPKHSIDRIDVNGHYEPGNCRWVTHKEQCGNTRRTSMLTVNGITKSRIEWCKEYGIAWHTIRNRLKQGWTPEQAIAKPVGKYVRKTVERTGT